MDNIDAPARGMGRTKALQEIKRKFYRRSDLRGCADFLFYWSLILLTFALVHLAPGAATYGVSVVLIAWLQHALWCLQHDAWHRLCLASKRWNDRVGAWLYAYPIGSPFHHARQRHLEHHRHIGSPDDPDWPEYANTGHAPPAALAWFFVKRAFGGLFLETVVAVLVRRRHRLATRSPAGQPSEYGRIALCQLLLLGAAALSGRWWDYFVLWLLPLATVTSLLISLRGFIEHAHPADGAGRRARLYNFTPTALERLFLCPCDFQYHALHHALPRVPHYHLGAALVHARRRGLSGVGRRRPGYLRCLAAHVRRLADGTIPTPTGENDPCR